MGNVFERLYEGIFGRNEMRIVMIGLDGAGKTSILYRLKLGEWVTTVPTVGFNVKSVDHKNVTFTIYDVGGQDYLRPLWRYYYHGAQGFIFVLDSGDVGRMEEAKHEINTIVTDDDHKEAIFLIFANKQDLPSAMSVVDITSILGLRSHQKTKWCIRATSATTGDGLMDGLDWLIAQMKAEKR